MTSRTSHSERLRFAVIDETGLRTQSLGPIFTAIRPGRLEKMAAGRHEAAGKEDKSKVTRLDFVLY